MALTPAVAQAATGTELGLLAPQGTIEGRDNMGEGAIEGLKQKNMNRLLKRPILNVIENHAISYPTPDNISYM
jgi:hypothetical protein